MNNMQLRQNRLAFPWDEHLRPEHPIKVGMPVITVRTNSAYDPRSCSKGGFSIQYVVHKSFYNGPLYMFTNGRADEHTFRCHAMQADKS